MLKRLAIANLAIIENVDVSFKEGFTVLTGATGAGKSLIVDSLALLLGGRASSELIRTGEDKATITGTFSLDDSRLEAKLSKLGVRMDDGILVVERTISKSKSQARLNGVIVSISDLASVSSYIADIHSQFDFEKVMDPESYLSIIDGYSPDLIDSYKREYVSSLSVYRTDKDHLDTLLERKRKLDESRDLYEFQLKELKSAGLAIGEEEEIASEISLLKNYDKIYELTQEANSIIHEDFLDRLYELNRLLLQLSSFQPQYKEAYDKLNNGYYEMDDTFSGLKESFYKLDYDPDSLDRLETRESELSQLKRKYHKSIEELISYRDELSSMIGDDSAFESELAAAKETAEVSFSDCLSKGKDLSSVRRRISKSIERELEKAMASLLLKAGFRVSFDDRSGSSAPTLKDDGIDTVDFLIETNIGEGMKSLSKTVSGGEASRIMLAFKAVLAKTNHIPTIIFDEIDTGVSGNAAEAVARKIKEISLNSQVIAITHLPQIASLSDRHILISKVVKDGRTFVKTKELPLDEKIQEVAELISGGKVTPKQLDYAREMVLGER